ncbi:MAG TPA: tRNA uridine-5-carboxymethylaminomethyl(34) synthesis enzyme MnmG [Tepidisphaeraceae bacterium]|nr:tRNA uridine-5-carboxymethylaminomethyl(34) synthesis enzyme MnmG [Tepidisphaeraceae bacterium]
MKQEFDIIVIGGGHAGAEAAWVGARLGASVAIITLDPARIGQMSCNPAIGGLAKGQMVREIDALGGLMGIATDNTGIQFRMLNRSKGPAVWGPRAQADKYKYAVEVQRLLATCPNLHFIAGEVADIDTECDSPGGGSASCVTGVTLADGRRISCRAVVVGSGTFLRGLMHTGERKTQGGRVGEAAAAGLSGCLARLGLELGRLKTGTPPRLRKQSIDFSAFEVQPGDEIPLPFSYLNEYGALPVSSAAPEEHWTPPLPQVNCWMGATNETIHEIIRANLHRAPMYSGQISSTGPRYCPSIEDKVVRFADKNSHHIFLEPEGLDTDEIYCNGISTSLPADVQDQIIRLVKGLEKAEVLRYGYAVEYDMVWPTQIRATLEVKNISGLFLAGQINGTSGYEEAAAQGLTAGVNAARYVGSGVADFVLRRDQAYIGVMIDDLVTKPPTEPYRMFTSRAEHRLHLRNDNADQRLTPVGREIGLVDDSRWARFDARRAAIESGAALLRVMRIGQTTGFELLRRPESTWESVAGAIPALSALGADVGHRLEILAKYEGYIVREQKQIERMAKDEQKLIPPTLDYAAITNLRTEARQKFSRFTPRSLGQALRISGITPADVTVLAIHLMSDRGRGATQPGPTTATAT